MQSVRVCFRAIRARNFRDNQRGVLQEDDVPHVVPEQNISRPNTETALSCAEEEQESRAETRQP